MAEGPPPVTIDTRMATARRSFARFSVAVANRKGAERLDFAAPR
jgi:hypothetical protein